MQIQGSSALATPAKQDGLTGMVDMLTLMRKNHFRPVVIADFYCGSGENVIDGLPINGSPISIIEGINKAIRKMSDAPKCPMYLVFNDIVSQRVMDALPRAIERWQEENGLEINKDQITFFNKSGKPFSVRVVYTAGSAQDLSIAILDLITKNYHVIALIDPNGPKDAPWDALRKIYDRFPRSLEMIFHVSANTLKRVAKARQVVDFSFAPMPDHIQAMREAFKNSGGLIRQPIGHDQWTMILLSRNPPRNGWNPKNGPCFFKLDDPEGKNMVSLLSTTAKERAGK